MFTAKVEGYVKQKGAGAATEKVVVAVRAERVISKTALAWALSHVVHAGDCITLLAVFAAKKTGDSIIFTTILRFLIVFLIIGNLSCVKRVCSFKVGDYGTSRYWLGIVQTVTGRDCRIGFARFPNLVLRWFSSSTTKSR